MICSPMVMTGFSEYFGSCITMLMRPPRRVRSVRFEAVSRSMPSKARRLAVTSPGGGVRPEDRAARLRLAGAGLAHDAEALAAELEGHAAHRFHGAGAQVKADAQIFDVEKRLRHLAAFGSRTSRRPSPSRLKPRLTTKMARPGMAATHH